jgi:hypothetical protein
MNGVSMAGVYSGMGVGDGLSRGHNRGVRPDDPDREFFDDDDDDDESIAAHREYDRQQRSREPERASAQRSHHPAGVASANSKGIPQAARRRLSRRDRERKSHVGSSHAGSSHAGSSHAGSSHVGSSHAGSSHVGSSHVGSSHVGSSHVGSSHVGSSHVGSSHVGSSHVGSSHVGTKPDRSVASAIGANPDGNKETKSHAGAAAEGRREIRLTLRNRNWLYLLGALCPGQQNEMLHLFAEVEERHRRLVAESDGSEVAELLADEVITCWLERQRCCIQEQHDAHAEDARVTARTRATESATKRLLNALKVYREYKAEMK